ncbi:threonine ammonia-lyase, biosynthetic [Candidatus Saccharibacteria bacterium]|nr:MAG: threonine ammonia-lyase, biosynthetic [Candidatus Saccharibacteria bacterium]
MSPIVVDDLVRDVLTARVYDVAVKTPLQQAHKLSASIGCQVYLKREDLQPVHSFKIRGAYNKIAALSEDERKKGVIAASAGNHAQGVALAAKKLGTTALIVMPRTTPSIKVEAVKGFGGQVELHGDNYSDAAEYCKQRTQETGRTYIHPFDDPLVIAGQGTIGREIIEQLPQASHVFVCVGGGGLLAGVAGYVKAIRPDIRVISVEPADSNCMQAAVAADKRLTLPHVGIFADGVAVRQAGEHTYRIAKQQVDDFITVTTDQICSAIKYIYEDTRSIVEPAGALGVAGICQYQLPADAHAVAICSGANVTFERLQQIAERTLIGSGKEALFSVVMPEKPGALRHFCSTVVGDRNITEFAYRLNERDRANVLVGISVADDRDRQALAARFEKSGYAHTDLSDSDAGKEHVRHMIGGHGQATTSEHIYQIDFPERPRALGDFLQALDDRWNISLFHYRSMASDSGNVLIGLEASNRAQVERAFRSTGYSYQPMDADKAVQTFLK